MCAQADALRTAREKIEHGQRLVEGFIGSKRGGPISSVGVQGLHVAWDNNVVGEPHRIKADSFRLLGEGPEGCRTGSGAIDRLGQDTSEGYSHLAPPETRGMVILTIYEVAEQRFNRTFFLEKCLE